MWVRWNNRWVSQVLGGCVTMLLVGGLNTPTHAIARDTPGSRLVFDRVHFAPASDQLSATARWMIAQNVRATQVYEDLVVWIEGHADPAESKEPQALADRRARIVAAALAAAGVDLERIAGPVSFGSARPAQRGPSRRVEMREN